jgi:hypothetical protein
VAVYNVEIGLGGSITVVVEVLEADGTVSDLTGFTGEMQVRTSYDSTVVLATGDVTIGTGDDEGIVTGFVSADDLSLDLTWSAAYYDIRIVDDDDIEYIVKGTVRRFQTVTR